EQRGIVLPDGSRIELNTQSHVRVVFREKSREVNLLAGEVLFNVRHDSTRPFRVHVRDKIIEDVGTQFSIYLRPDASTTVSVLDGRVQVFSDQAEPDARSARTSEAKPAKNQKLDGQKSETIPSFTQLSAGEGLQIAAGGKQMKRVSVNPAE